MRLIRLAMIAGLAGTVLGTAAIAQNAAPAQPEVQPPVAQPAPGDQTADHDGTQQATGDRSGPIAENDANGDGSLSLEEYSSVEELQQADANKDGTLSVDEATALIEKRQAERRAQRLLARLDVNGDGNVTIAEVQDRRNKRFALLDINNDGKIEPSELGGSDDRRQGERSFGRGDDDGHPNRRGQHGKRADNDSGEQQYSQLEDHDGGSTGQHDDGSSLHQSD